MTHKDIYTKFMIEYDKANVTSSYPSLTEYEVATVLDKAYNALIALKVTGNNVRRVGFEGDLKSVTDLQPLIKTEEKFFEEIDDTNVLKVSLPTDYLYFVSGNLLWDHTKAVTTKNATVREPIAADGISLRKVPVKLVSHEMATKFIASASNIPWVKTPVCFIEDNVMYIVYDYLKYKYTVKDGEYDKDDSLFQQTNSPGFGLTYIKQPNKFVKDLSKMDAQTSKNVTYFDYEAISAEDKLKYEFECNSTVAEELISLAIAFALENVESQRLNSKLNMRGLEA